MTKKREDELGDEQLDEVTGGMVPAKIEYPNLTFARKSPGGAETTPGFMDYTDDSCMD